MDTQYEEYWHKAMELKQQTHSSINDQNHPVAHVLRHETSQLVDDIELRRKPDTIEDRIQFIQRQLVQARIQGDTVLRDERGVQLHHDYGKLRERVRESARR